MFDNWNAFNFLTVRMPSFISNIPSIVFYSSTMLEFVRITRSALLLLDSLSVAKHLLDPMISQDSSRQMLLKQIKKLFNRHPEAFQKYHVMVSDIINKIA